MDFAFVTVLMVYMVSNEGRSQPMIFDAVRTILSKPYLSASLALPYHTVMEKVKMLSMT